MLAKPTNEQDAWNEVMASFQRFDSISHNLQTMEDQVELFLESRISDAYQTIRLALIQTKSPIEAITYLHLMHWTPCVGPEKPPVIRPQYKIGKYTADFMVEYGRFKFAIECDGHDFHEKTKEQAAHDKKRDREITSKGYVVMRFTGSEIWKKPWIACNALDDYLYEDSRRDENEGVDDAEPDH